MPDARTSGGAARPSGLRAILQKKTERKERLLRNLSPIVQLLASLGAVRVVLFGSLARDEVDIGSDVDLLAVMPAERSGKEWSRLIHPRIEADVAVELLVFNSTEFAGQVSGSSFLRSIVETGRVLYEKTPG
jgi:predicted nucleotidyltransferase